jgi:biopolymer transport protein ExbD
MRIRDPFQEAEEPFNLVPLTDMVFNLLIFFMAATTFARVEKEVGVRLPKAASFAGMSAVPQQLVINIDAQGRPVVARKPYDLSGLGDLLRGVVAKNPRATVVIRADERGLVKGFAQVLDACKRAGVDEARIVYTSAASAP